MNQPARDLREGDVVDVRLYGRRRLARVERIHQTRRGRPHTVAVTVYELGRECIVGVTSCLLIEQVAQPAPPPQPAPTIADLVADVPPPPRWTLLDALRRHPSHLLSMTAAKGKVTLACSDHGWSWRGPFDEAVQAWEEHIDEVAAKATGRRKR